jgi:hypothetical protein
VNNEIKNKKDAIVNETVDEVVKKSNNFLGDDNGINEYIKTLLDKFFNFIGSILKPDFVEGHLDDLIGQQIIIHIILFVLLISIILLFIFFVANIYFLLYKDKLINKVDNKIFTFYIKYQSFFAKFSLIYLPIIIIFALLVLGHGLYFLITHQIPFEVLGIDLHTFIGKK